MNKLSIIAVALFVTSFAAQAAEPVAAPIKTAQATQAAVGVAPQKVVSQQDKMRDCSKQATGKKGAERRAFMKTCLSKKV